MGIELLDPNMTEEEKIKCYHEAIEHADTELERNYDHSKRFISLFLTPHYDLYQIEDLDYLEQKNDALDFLQELDDYGYNLEKIYSGEDEMRYLKDAIWWRCQSLNDLKKDAELKLKWALEAQEKVA